MISEPIPLSIIMPPHKKFLNHTIQLLYQNINAQEASEGCPEYEYI